MDIRFYHITTTTLEKALPQLLDKIYGLGKRSLVLFDSQERLESLDNTLWTFGGDSFLPHGHEGEGRPDDQPVWLSTSLDNANKANVVVLCDDHETIIEDGYEIVCEIFNGQDDQAVKNARKKWKTYQAQDHQLSYWQQNNKGQWEKKAS